MKNKNNVISEKMMKEILLLGSCILAGVIIGTIYAISTKQNNILFFTIHEYIISGYENVPKFEVIKAMAYQYTQIALLIVVLGTNRYTMPLMFVVFVVLGISYGFTAACFGILFGLTGIGIGIFNFGIQGLILIICVGYIGVLALEQLRNKKIEGLKKYVKNGLNIIVLMDVACIIYMYLYLIVKS